MWLDTFVQSVIHAFSIDAALVKSANTTRIQFRKGCHEWNDSPDRLGVERTVFSDDAPYSDNFHVDEAPSDTHIKFVSVEDR